MAFRGVFITDLPCEAHIQMMSSTWTLPWLDGSPLGDGLPRFDPAQAEYITHTTPLSGGRHVIALHVVHEGVGSKRQPLCPSFVWCRVLVAGQSIATMWRCIQLPGYAPSTRRINGDLGWIDCCDTRQNPLGWELPQFDDASWPMAMPATHALAEIRASGIRLLLATGHRLEPVASGFAAEAFGYADNDPPVRLFLRDLQCEELPPQGVWRRYDLGRVRLGRPRMVLDVPAGTVVEFAYAETLRGGRVAPWITLSNGPSCNFDRFIARGGQQVFEPTTPKGGRFVEIHVMPPAGMQAQVRFISQEHLERCYHGQSPARFTCDDPQLAAVWDMGIQTYRACAEDAIIDNPTRERGQWTGDALVGLETAAAGFGDLSLLRQMLLQAGRTSRPKGMIRCLSPSQSEGVIPSFAAMWVTAAMQFHRYSGDIPLLREAYDDALRTMVAFEQYITPEGLAADAAGWSFIDWGYARPQGAVDPALNIHYLMALRNMCGWCSILERPDDMARFYDTIEVIRLAICKWIDGRRSAGGWENVGYHATALALRAWLIEGDDERDAVAYIKQHILSCFPNHTQAPRLSDPAVTSRQLITPFFAHFAFPALIERGEMDFVLDQYRTCWGWMLEAVKATTCLEVFDTRWSHCHQWSACPTWQLTRYGLGLHARYDRGQRHFELNLRPGALKHAAGRLPLPDGDIDIEWSRNAKGIDYVLQTPATLWLHPHNAPQCVPVTGRWHIHLPAANHTFPTFQPLEAWNVDGHSIYDIA